MKKFLIDNFLLVSFIISFCLHTIFYFYGDILSKSKKEIQFQKLTFVSISQNLEDKDKSFDIGKDVKKIVEKEQDIKKQEEIIQKPFSPYESEKPQYKAAGGGAEIITSTSEDLSLGSSSEGNFVVQNIPKGKGEGIGLGGKGSGIGVGEVDKEKILKEYLAKIIEKIEKNKKYPESARKENIEGKTEVKITISKTGVLKEVKIVSSSGYKILDETAILTVKNVSPFPSIPEALEKENLSIKFKIVFRLEEK